MRRPVFASALRSRAARLRWRCFAALRRGGARALRCRARRAAPLGVARLDEER